VRDRGGAWCCRVVTWGFRVAVWVSGASCLTPPVHRMRRMVSRARGPRPCRACIGADHRGARESIPPPAHVIPLEGRIMYDRITVVDSVRGPPARGGGAGRAFAIRARLLSTFVMNVNHDVNSDIRFGRANGCGAGDPRPRRALARACCSSCTLHRLHLHPPVANFATVGSGRADRGRRRQRQASAMQAVRIEAEDKREPRSGPTRHGQLSVDRISWIFFIEPRYS